MTLANHKWLENLKRPRLVICAGCLAGTHNFCLGERRCECDCLIIRIAIKELGMDAVQAHFRELQAKYNS